MFLTGAAIGLESRGRNELNGFAPPVTAQQKPFAARIDGQQFIMIINAQRFIPQMRWWASVYGANDRSRKYRSDRWVNVR
jgi:hypothetical protein